MYTCRHACWCRVKQRWTAGNNYARAAVLSLQESDRESQELQQQLKAAADERSHLQAAAQAATAQQREHEQLVSDLTHAVQQQKSQTQVSMQRMMHTCRL
jgi:chromosome segregation ATPase